MHKDHKKQGLFINPLSLITKAKNKSYFYLSKLIPTTLLNILILYFSIFILIIFAILIVFFYDKHWRNIRYQLAYNLVSDIYYTITIMDNKLETTVVSNLLYEKYNKITVYEDLPKSVIKSYTKKRAHLYKNTLIISSILKSRYPNVVFYIKNDKHKNISILVPLKNNRWLEFYISQNALFISSLKSILIATILLYLLIIIFNYIFFKFQLTPLKKLSNYVTEFGKGTNVGYILPKGSLEIKNTIKAFNEMKERINHYIEQKNLMLSSISHDLKSSLTKMMLLVELNNIEDLSSEINNMNEMISSYLLYARDEMYEEKKVLTKIKLFFNNAISIYKKNNPDKDISVTYNLIFKEINIKPIIFKRAINNLLDNALKYGNNISLTVKDYKRTNLKIIIDDDGPGIPYSQYLDVFKPFYKINNARTYEKGSVGLGLNIVKDAINKHGGNIKLTKSPKKGLRVIILLPY